MTKTFLLLACLGASCLACAQAQAPIEGVEIPTLRVRFAYSHTARTADDEIWAYSYSDVLKGRDRVIVVYLVAANRTGGRDKSGLEWELPYSGLIMESIELGTLPVDGQLAISIGARTPAGDSVDCTLLYGFEGDGSLRRTLTDAGCA